MLFLGLAVSCLAQAGGTTPPDFSATDISGQKVSLSELKGKVELDALVAKGITFVSDKYLPEKLKSKDFLD